MAELETASVNVYVTIVGPIAKVEPETWVVVMATGGFRLSVALGSVHVTVAVGEVGSVAWFISVGQPLIIGGSNSESNRHKFVDNRNKYAHMLKRII